MISFSRNRWLIVALGHYLTLFFVSQMNFYLSASGIQFFVLGMLISFSALELSLKQGMLSLAPIAFYLDSRSPLPFGFTLVLSLILCTIAHLLRSKVRREVSTSAMATTIILNIVSYGVYTVGAAKYLGAEAIHFWPVVLNLFASTFVVIIINKIFFDTHTGVLAIFGINLAEEQREPL
ncbi:hypothetical protein [Pelagicoccus albus]|uniref:Uncharacterized protein n=1 Tax=Pelagicoccus albus TaxID=415222 RepID=A0A7X1E7Z9_9BACT|nr:hypothetical protein [Pelagicoccus albus]MBC2605673.1 hypothetical protein [Pelagicoccus albus]